MSPARFPHREKLPGERALPDFCLRLLCRGYHRFVLSVVFDIVRMTLVGKVNREIVARSRGAAV